MNPIFKKDPTQYHQQLEGSAPDYGSRTKLAQVYPYRFCSTLIRCILPLGNLRALYPSQLSLAVDLLEDLNLGELQGVQNQLAELTASEHPVLATDLYEQGLPVRDYYTKRLLNRINALPAGNAYHPVQIEAQQDVSHVRQMYLSTSMFDNAVIFCGSFQSLRVEYRHTHTHTACSYPRDLLQLIASHWSAILFWNNDGSIPSDNTPDDPHTPNPGFPPDDDPFHTPFHSPPRPSDDTPDDEMHPSQDEPPVLTPHPSSPPDHPQPPFPGANAIPFAPDTVMVPNTIIPPDIEDTPMTHSTKRPPGDPPIPPATKARPSRQVPPGVIHSHQSHQTRPHNPL